jgi:hypothetical protein
VGHLNSEDISEDAIDAVLESNTAYMDAHADDLQKAHPDSWVAVTQGKLLGADADYPSLWRRLRDAGQDLCLVSWDWTGDGPPPPTRREDIESRADALEELALTMPTRRERRFLRQAAQQLLADSKKENVSGK